MSMSKPIERAPRGGASIGRAKAAAGGGRGSRAAAKVSGGGRISNKSAMAAQAALESND